MIHKKQTLIGNILIITSLLFLAYIYYPFATSYLFPTHITNAQTENSQSYTVQIPKINAIAPIVLNVDPWNQTEYREKLRYGVAHAKNTALPGEKGGTYLFAHSSDYPWNITRYNTAFFKLSELKKGDTIRILHGKKTYTYTVTDVKEVWPNELEYLTTRSSDLVLQTCTPLGTDLKRLLVFATLQK